MSAAAAGSTLSVVVTSYNYGRFVEEAIDSVLAQTVAPLDIVVVDDGSTDDSVAILRARYGADPRVTLVLTGNAGQLAAFQVGLAHSRGSVVCFLDADDRWSPDYLGKVAAQFDRGPGVEFVFTDLHLFGDTEGRIRYADHPIDFGCTVISTYFDVHWYGAPTSALSMRRDFAERALDLPEAFRDAWRLSADNCLVFGASIAGARKHFMPTGGVHYRVHGENGWWGRETAHSKYMNRLRSRGLIEHYARLAGVTVACADDVKYEFRTKPTPSWKETRRYARLAMRGRASFSVRMRRSLEILLSYARPRRRA